MIFRLAWCAVLAVSLSLVARGAEAPKPSDADIQKMIQNLSSEDFDTREKAESDLMKAGSSAIPLINKALEGGDAELRARGKRVLDELEWAVRPPVTNVADALPPTTVFVLHTTNLKAGVQKLRTETALGKLYDRPEITELTAMAKDAATKQMNDGEKKAVDAWFDRYGGPTGVSLMSIDPTKDWKERELGVVVFGITDPDRAKAWSDLTGLMPLGGGEQLTRERYHGIDIEHTNGEWRQEGRARVINLGVHSLDSSYKAVGLVIDQVGNEKSAKLSAAPTYVEAMGKIDAAPVASLYFNFDELFKQTTIRQNPRDKVMLEALGFETIKTIAVSMSTGNELIAERAWLKVEGERKGLVKLLSFGKTTGKLAALAPADALAMLTVPADGKMIYDTILGIAKTGSPNDAAEFETGIAQMDQGLGIKIVDQIVAPLKGEASLWVVKPAGPMPIPELGAAFETKDEASAKALSDALAKLIAGGMGKPEACGAADFKGRACHWLNKEALGGNFPYAISWCADGARVLFSTSQEGLQTLVNRIENKAAGLDGAEDFKRMMAMLPEADRGGMIYINTAEVGGWGLPLVMTMMNETTPPEVKEKMNAALKDPKAMLKGFPGTLLSIAGTPDGIQARGLGGIPASTNLISVPVIIAQLMWRRTMMEIEKAAAVQAVEEAKTEEAKSEAKTEAKTEEAKSEAPAVAPTGK